MDINKRRQGKTTIYSRSDTKQKSQHSSKYRHCNEIQGKVVLFFLPLSFHTSSNDKMQQSSRLQHLHWKYKSTQWSLLKKNPLCSSPSRDQSNCFLHNIPFYQHNHLTKNKKQILYHKFIRLKETIKTHLSTLFLSNPLI